MKTVYMLGNDAIARGLVEGGLEAAFAYPGTPSSEIVDALAVLAREAPIRVEWSVNEKTAYEAAYGASISGRRACAVMKHVGLNVAADAFMTSAYTGVVGGLVLVVADDPSIHSSQNEQDSRRYAFFAGVPCLEPSNPREALAMAAAAPELSERLGLPVMLRTVTRLSHGKSDIVTGERAAPPARPGFVRDPGRFVMVPGNARAGGKALHAKAPAIAEALAGLPFGGMEDGSGPLGVIASGVAWEFAREARDAAKEPFPLLKVGAYPVPEEPVRRILAGCGSVLVLEEVDPVIEEIVVRVAKDAAPGCAVRGKLDGTVPREGELSVEAAAAAIERAAGRTPAAPAAPADLPPRNPVLCAGCPHAATFALMKKAFGRNAVFAGDIGCYTLGVRLGAIDTCLCMGGGIGMAVGMALFEKDRPVVAVIGDSTFFHAGIPPLINACYAGADMIVLVLDNRTTAMTGHQPHPGTGGRVSGDGREPLDIARVARACGVSDVAGIDPLDAPAALAELARVRAAKGVRVVIARSPCRLLPDVPRGKRAVVDSERCTGCRACVNTGCPAISYADRKARIDASCVGCGFCAQICPAGAIGEADE